MTIRPLIIRPAATADLAHARGWYEQQRAGLGGELLDAVKFAMAAIQENPGAFAPIHKEIRRALVPRFPYGIFFVVEEEHLVVVAVVHLKRNPSRWKRRS